jgi:hypothetical protein
MFACFFVPELVSQSLSSAVASVHNLFSRTTKAFFSYLGVSEAEEAERCVRYYSC